MGRGNRENYNLQQSVGKRLFAWQQPHLPHSQTISGTLQALLLAVSTYSTSFVSPADSMWLHI